MVYIDIQMLSAYTFVYSFVKVNSRQGVKIVGIAIQMLVWPLILGLNLHLTTHPCSGQSIVAVDLASSF